MTKAPRSKRTKNVPPSTMQAAASEVMRRHVAELRRQGGRVNYDLLPDLTLADLRTGVFEMLSLPLVAAEVKKLADKEGITIDVWMHAAIAEGYQRLGYPLPPDLREYLLTQEMPPVLRNRLLKPSLS